MAKEKAKSKAKPRSKPKSKKPARILPGNEIRARADIIDLFDPEEIEWQELPSVSRDGKANPPQVQRARIVGGWLYMASLDDQDASLTYVPDENGVNG